MINSNKTTPKFRPGDRVQRIDWPDFNGTRYYTVRTAFNSPIYGLCYWLDTLDGGAPIPMMDYQLRIVSQH